MEREEERTDRVMVCFVSLSDSTALHLIPNALPKVQWQKKRAYKFHIRHVCLFVYSLLVSCCFFSSIFFDVHCPVSAVHIVFNSACLFNFVCAASDVMRIHQIKQRSFPSSLLFLDAFNYSICLIISIYLLF